MRDGNVAIPELVHVLCQFHIVLLHQFSVLVFNFRGEVDLLSQPVVDLVKALDWQVRMDPGEQFE